MERDYLFNPEKIKYVKGDKPDVSCILCAIRDDRPEVKNLTVFRNSNFIISVNLYPFNPGHLMLFPVKHMERIGDFSSAEILEMHSLLSSAVDILDEEFQPHGYNIGYNLGQGSGASIPHIHQHIVPRYSNEVGFLDVLAGTRVIVSDPVQVRDRLIERFSHIS